MPVNQEPLSAEDKTVLRDLIFVAWNSYRIRTLSLIAASEFGRANTLCER